MKFMFSSVLALLRIQSVFGSSTASAGLVNCPFTTLINPSLPTVDTLSNNILSRFTITASQNAADPASPVARYNLFQRVGPNGKKFLYLQLLPPVVAGAYPKPNDTVQVKITLNAKNTITSPYVPLIHTVLSSVTGTTYASIAPNTFVYTFSCPTDYLSAVITIVELGYVNSATYKMVCTSLIGTFYSDLLASAPFNGEVKTFTAPVPQAFTLPTNKEAILARTYRCFKKAATSICVPEAQVKKMEIAAFINELGCTFKSKECVKSICNAEIYAEYITFFVSCIKTIVYCEEVKQPKVEFCPAGGVVVNTCATVNTGICRFAQNRECSAKIAVGVNVEICTMFPEASEGVYNPVPCDDLLPIIEPECESISVCEEEIISRSSSSSTVEEEKKIKKKVAPKKRVAVKTTTTVSTYGWYALGGGLVVLVAVGVYVLVL